MSLTAAEAQVSPPRRRATPERAWDRSIPFLVFPPAVRKVIYTTNSIESLNFQLRKIIKNRGHFPNDQAVIKLLWLAIRDIEDKRAHARAKDAGKPANRRTGPARLVEGGTVQGWNAAINALTQAYPNRINPTY
jgi:putative transposase